MSLRRLAPALVLAAAVVSVAVGATRTITIVGDERIGSFRVKTDGTLGGAIAAFGAPTAVRKTSSQSCTATWRPLGLTISFYNLGGADPCSRRGGLFGRAIARGAVWRTSKGLRIGDPVARLRTLYPNARFHPGLRLYWPAGYWLLPRRNRFGLPGSYPGLLAETRAGRVVAFHVRYQAGGE
jgi:hypothetical protein